MGVAFGKFVAADSYRQIQPECQASCDQSRLALSVGTPLGVQVPCLGGDIVDVTDQFEDVDPEDIVVTVVGIAYPLYAELFPRHVAD